jgi:hypothetical protein
MATKRTNESKTTRASGASKTASSGARRPAAKTTASKSTAKSRSAAPSMDSSGNGSTHSGALSRTTTDHDEIREWAEERGAHPACVRGTGDKGDVGMLRLDFPGYSEDELQTITWDEFFDKFEERELALVYQEKTAGGARSNFNKLISRGGVQDESRAGTEEKPKTRTAR